MEYVAGLGLTATARFCWRGSYAPPGPVSRPVRPAPQSLRSVELVPTNGGAGSTNGGAAGFSRRADSRRYRAYGAAMPSGTAIAADPIHRYCWKSHHQFLQSLARPGVPRAFAAGSRKVSLWHAALGGSGNQVARFSLLPIMLLEDLKRQAEIATGIARPSRREAQALVRDRKANGSRFADDRLTPNNPKWPLIHYRGVVKLDGRFDPAAIFEALFASRHGWRDGTGAMASTTFCTTIPRTHEVLGIAAPRNGKVRFGGARGRYHRAESRRCDRAASQGPGTSASRHPEISWWWALIPPGASMTNAVPASPTMIAPLRPSPEPGARAPIPSMVPKDRSRCCGIDGHRDRRMDHSGAAQA